MNQFSHLNWQLNCVKRANFQHDQHWRPDIYDVNGLASPSSNNSNRSRLNSPSKRTIQNKNQLIQQEFIYDNDNIHHRQHQQQTNQVNDAGCHTFAFWRECAGTPPAKTPPVRTRHEAAGSKKETNLVVRYTTADAILHQPDRPKVIVKPCPAPKTKSTTNLNQNSNGNSLYDCDDKIGKDDKRYCRAEGNFAFAQPEQYAQAYAYYDPHSNSAMLSTCMQELSDYQMPANGMNGHSVYSNAEYALHLQDPLLDYVEYPVNHNYQQLILDQRLLQPSMTSSCISTSSIFQLSPQPYLDEFVELSPATSVDDFPPPLRPISCEEQIRNLHYLQQPPATMEYRNNETDNNYSMKNAKQNQSHEKRVTFASCPPSRHKNTMQALNACSLDNYNYIDNLPFANENVGTIKGKMNNANGQHCNNRKSINEIFNADSPYTG